MSKLDVVMLSFGWFFVGLTVGAEQMNLLFAKLILVAMVAGTVLAFVDS